MEYETTIICIHHHQKLRKYYWKGFALVLLSFLEHGTIRSNIVVSEFFLKTTTIFAYNTIFFLLLTNLVLFINSSVESYLKV